MKRGGETPPEKMFQWLVWGDPHPGPRGYYEATSGKAILSPTAIMCTLGDRSSREKGQGAERGGAGRRLSRDLEYREWPPFWSAQNLVYTFK